MLSVVTLAFAGCGGSTPSGKSAQDEASGGAMTKGQQCLSDAETPREPKEGVAGYISVSHILVRHAGLKRPMGATRTAEEACLRALKALEALKGGAGWEDVVAEYSDAPGLGNDGSLGRLTRDDADSDFANAAFSLEVEELSYVVKSDRGFHIILRTD